MVMALSTFRTGTQKRALTQEENLCSSGNFRGNYRPSIGPVPPNLPLRFYGGKHVEWGAVPAGRWVGTNGWKQSDFGRIATENTGRSLNRPRRYKAVILDTLWNIIYFKCVRNLLTRVRCNCRRKRNGKRWKKGSNKMGTFGILRRFLGFQPLPNTAAVTH